jgi:hypothetical protein
MFCNTDLTVSGNVLGWSPFWCAGMVDANANVLVSRGKVGFTCMRVATGNFRIDFASPHPNGANYVVTITTVYVNQWVDQLTSSSFLAVLWSSTYAQQNATLSFTVLD